MADQQVVLEIYLKELWAEYALGNVFLLLRLFSRYKTVGLQGFGLDDYFTGLVMVVWAVYTACASSALTMPSNVGLTPETAAAVPSDQYATYEHGGRVVFVSWIFYVTYVWCIKATALSFFARLCAGLPGEMAAVKCVAIFTAAGYVASILTQVLGCLPVHHSWQVFPFPGEQCTTRKLNYYIIGTLNPFTDLLCCMLPVPILIKLQLPMKRKLMLCPLFFSGLFVAVASVLRSYYSLQSLDQILQSAFWSSREFFVAAATVSIPCMRPLFIKSTWRGGLRSGNSHSAKAMSSGGDNTPYYYGRGTGGSGGGSGQRSVQVSGGDYEMHSRHHHTRRPSQGLMHGTRLSPIESDEDLMMRRKDEVPRSEHSDEIPRAIHVTTEYSVSSDFEAAPKLNV
ncbi:hypothetical protein PG985_006505 [Apiospora marii]|uniref:Rhodopsin domain-containing protein n=1 Tax=Apiospora marii TaxID=335849 RepID=A0ABR1S7V4_9PEZI